MEIYKFFVDFVKVDLEAIGSMDVNCEETFKIIQLYEQFPCLWNYSISSYKNVSMKNNAWKEIANALGKTTEEVKKKIKHLRSAYVVEKKKVDASKKSGSSADSVYEPHLYYYDNMNFLAPVVVLRKEESENVIEFDSETFIGSQTEPFSSEITTEESCKLFNDTCGSISTPPSLKSAKKIKIEREEKFNSALDVIIKKANDAECETMYSVFGKTIALQLKELPLLTAANAMAEIQKYIASVVEHHVNGDIIATAMTSAHIYE